MNTSPEQLEDRAVFATLSQATLDLREQLPVSESSAIASESDARAAIASLLEQQLGRSIDPDKQLTHEKLDSQVARDVLSLMLADVETHAITAEAIANPPRDSQKSVELAIAGAVILGSLVTWLQTSVEIDVHRQDGKTVFNFKLKKAATKGKTLTDIAHAVLKLIP
jgi:hypothetical protein